MTSISTSKQGQSEATELKERGLQAAFALNMRIFVERFQNEYTYWHFDLNCGSGYNADVDCIGSPLAFLRAADEEGCSNYFAGFCDINQDSLGELAGREEIANNPSCYVFQGSNASLIDAIPDIITHGGDKVEQAVGMVVCDPNGTEVPLDQLGWLSSICPKLDFVVNWNSRAFKLRRSCGHDVKSMPEAIYSLNKRHWHISPPFGKFRFTLLVGKNTPTGELSKVGFFHIESQPGQAIFDKCAFPSRYNCREMPGRQTLLRFG